MELDAKSLLLDNQLILFKQFKASLGTAAVDLCNSMTIVEAGLVLSEVAEVVPWAAAMIVVQLWPRAASFSLVVVASWLQEKFPELAALRASPRWQRPLEQTLRKLRPIQLLKWSLESSVVAREGKTSVIMAARTELTLLS